MMTGELLTCVFQPIVNLKDFEAIGFELLSRGPQESELHRPDALFDIARSEGRVTELDRLCRRTASQGRRGAAARTACASSTPSRSPCSCTPTATSFVNEIVEATPSSLRGLTVIEITENSVIDDFDRMRDIVRQLRAHGFRVAIDDAGAGYAGLQTMVEIEPDFIKLDMSLIRGVEIVDRQAAPRAHAARLLPRGRDHAHRRGHRDAQAARHPARARRRRTGRASSSAIPGSPAAAAGRLSAAGSHHTRVIRMPRTMTTHDKADAGTLRDGAAQPHRPSNAAQHLLRQSASLGLARVAPLL